jgi:excisionase family DNA binding protein
VREADVITELRKVFELFEQQRNLSLGSAALRLDVTKGYIRKHLAEIGPNAFRVPGGAVRIPQADLDTLMADRRVFPKAK